MGVDCSAFMISTNKKNATRIGDFEGEEEEDHIARIWTTVDEIAVETIIN